MWSTRRKLPGTQANLHGKPQKEQPRESKCQPKSLGERAGASAGKTMPLRTRLGLPSLAEPRSKLKGNPKGRHHFTGPPRIAAAARGISHSHSLQNWTLASGAKKQMEPPVWFSPRTASDLCGTCVSFEAQPLSGTDPEEGAPAVRDVGDNQLDLRPHH